MKIKTNYTQAEFEQALCEFSSILYHDHSLKNLQCHQAVHSGFYKAFVLLDDEKNVLAMACLSQNPELYFEGKQAICLSHYECVNHQQAANLLLQTIVEECKNLAGAYLLGPINGSTWHNHRFACEPISDHYLSETYHQAYYAQQFIDFGFDVAANYLTQIDTSMALPYSSHQLDATISLRTLNKDHYEQEMLSIFDFCSQAFKANFLYSPIEKQAFMEKYMGMKDIIKPELVILAEENGQMVGLLLALHDFYHPSEKRLIVKTLARKNQRKYMGLGYHLCRKIMDIAIEHNYQSVLHAFMHQSNVSNKVSDKFSGQAFRHYQLFYQAL